MCSSEKLAPAPTSVPSPTVTPQSQACFRLKRPLPSSRFDDGQKAAEAPAAVIRHRASGSAWTQWAKTDLGVTRPWRA